MTFDAAPVPVPAPAPVHALAPPRPAPVSVLAPAPASAGHVFLAGGLTSAGKRGILIPVKQIALHLFCERVVSVQEKDLKIGLLCDFYGTMLTDKQREATEMYYDDDLSLAEIAEHAGITRQGVWDSIRRAEMILLEMEEKLGLAARFMELAANVERIKDLAEQIRQINHKRAISGEIDALADEIVRISDRIVE